MERLDSRAERTLTRRRLTALGAGALASIAFVRAPARAATIVYKYAHNLPVSHPIHVANVQLFAIVEAETGGKVHVDIFPNNQLGSDSSMLAQVRSGAIQFFQQTGAFVGQIFAPAQLENLAYAFKDETTAFAAMDGDFGDYLKKELRPKGLVLMPRTYGFGFRDVTTSTKPVRTADDFAGLKLRTPPAKLWVEFFKTLGASPTPINFNETYTALQTKIVDGQENPLAIIETARLFEVQRYLSVTNHMWTGDWLMCNTDAWDALPQDVRDSILRHQPQIALQERRDIALLNASLLDKLGRRGMQVNANVDVPSIKARLAGYYADARSDFGATGMSLIEKYSGPLG